MRRLLLSLGITLLMALSGSFAQTSSSSTLDRNHASGSANQRQSSQQNPGNSAQDQSNPAGGSPNTAIPGRVTGDTPVKVQEELDKQLPAGSDVTASVADDGSLKLTGTVKNAADKAKAEKIAHQTSNKNVNNQIKVQSSSDNSSQSTPR